MNVLMKHPDLGDSQMIEVTEAAIPHYSRSGWVVVDSPAEVPAPTAKRRTRKEAE